MESRLAADKDIDRVTRLRTTEDQAEKLMCDASTKASLGSPSMNLTAILSCCELCAGLVLVEQPALVAAAPAAVPVWFERPSAFVGGFPTLSPKVRPDSK